MSKQMTFLDVNALIDMINYALSNKFHGDLRCVLKACRKALREGEETKQNIFKALHLNPKEKPSAIRK